MDDEHSSRRRARDRCIAGAVRESVQLEVGVEAQQHRFQRQSISRGRAIQCLPTFARMTGSKRRRTHIARRGRSMGVTVGGCHAAPMQSRKQASAGPTRDAWFATLPITGTKSTARSHPRLAASTPRAIAKATEHSLAKSDLRRPVGRDCCTRLSSSRLGRCSRRAGVRQRRGGRRTHRSRRGGCQRPLRRRLQGAFGRGRRLRSLMAEAHPYVRRGRQDGLGVSLA
jgi:hypothetical protein